jgi:hypothetical protein
MVKQLMKKYLERISNEAIGGLEEVYPGIFLRIPRKNTENSESGHPESRQYSK